MWYNMKTTTGQLIKRARLNAGLTQRKLAEKLGISAQGVAQWENDLRNPKAETIQRIAEAIGCSPRDLVPGATSPTEHGLRATEEEMGLPRYMLDNDAELAVHLAGAFLNMTHAGRVELVNYAESILLQPKSPGGDPDALNTEKDE